MRVNINNAEAFIGTGGQAFTADKPVVLFLHGSGLDHRGWSLQARWFAFNGYSVLAPDLPGHSLSGGEALTTIEETRDWLVAMLDLLNVQSVHAVGHSQGFLAALELAAMHPERVESLAGIGTAAAIPVNPALIETAEKSAFSAASMMLNWGFGSGIHKGASPVPGTQPIGQGRFIMGNNPLAADLKACAAYQGGAAAVASIASVGNCPAAMILAGQDKMTPIKAGRAVAEELGSELTILEEFGHMLPLEAPAEVLAALKAFIGQHATTG